MAYPTLRAGLRFTAAVAAAMQPLQVIKVSDESVTSSTTYQNDNELLLAVSAGAEYLLTLMLIHTGPTAADIKAQFTYPTGTTMKWGQVALVTGITGVSGDINMQSFDQTGQGFAGTFTSDTFTHIQGRVLAGATAGTLQLQWAQNASSGTAVTVRAGSWMRLERYA